MDFMWKNQLYCDILSMFALLHNDKIESIIVLSNSFGGINIMVYEVIDLKIDGYHLDTSAQLEVYRLDHKHKEEQKLLRPAVIICPGGGYINLSNREAEPIAMRYLAAGYHAFVLKYHVAPTRYPVALLELASTVKLLRDHADKWMIDESKIIVTGFSAGGHLAASLACFWNKDFLASALNTTNDRIKPDGCILSYPVITSGEFAHRGSFEHLLGDDESLLEQVSLEKQVSKDTPPVFIWHTLSDACVPVENSLLFVMALRKYNISTEFHMYPFGGHGLALANEETQTNSVNKIFEECQGWIDMAIRWIHNLGGEQC